MSRGPGVDAKTAINNLTHNLKRAGITIEDARAELSKYQDIKFETIEGKCKILDDHYIILAVLNTQPHNGAWSRYIDHLKENYNSILVESVLNKRLYKWFIRNGFQQTKKNKSNVVWKKGVKNVPR